MNISKAICPNCGERMTITKAVCKTCGINLEGDFDLPQLAQLSKEEQNFIVAFVKVHGSIKKMEEILDISYPTVKNKLNTLADKLELDFSVSQSGENNDACEHLSEKFANFGVKFKKKITHCVKKFDPEKTAQNLDALDELSKGDISVEDAISRLGKSREE